MWPRLHSSPVRPCAECGTGPRAHTGLTDAAAPPEETLKQRQGQWAVRIEAALQAQLRKSEERQRQMTELQAKEQELRLRENDVRRRENRLLRCAPRCHRHPRPRTCTHAHTHAPTPTRGLTDTQTPIHTYTHTHTVVVYVTLLRCLLLTLSRAPWLCPLSLL
jgi:hypothetical protein